MRKYALIVAALAAIAGLIWGAFALKTEDTSASPAPTVESTVAPSEEPRVPAMPAALKNDLMDLGYTASPITSRLSEGSRRYYQTWKKQNEPTVELTGWNGGTFEIASVSFGAAGEWTSFSCSPADGETAIQAINTGKMHRDDVMNDTALISRETWMSDDEAQIVSSYADCTLRK